MIAKLTLKSGVLIQELDGLLVWMLWELCNLWGAYNIPEVVVTSGMDGKHMRGSLHYQGKALDIRRWNVPEEDLDEIVQTVRRILGKDWDVVPEKTHIHIEYDPDVPRAA